MRIVYCTDTYLPEVNGVTTVLATMRDSLRERGHEVLVLAPSCGRLGLDESMVHRLPAIPCPGYPQVRLSFPWGHGLGRRLAGFAPELVHAVTEGPLGAFGRGFALRNRLPLVTSFHTDFPRYAAHYLGPAAVPPTRWWLRRFHAPAHVTQTPSELTRHELVALGIPRTMVWGRGVDTRLFNPGRRSEDRRRQLGVPTDGVLVLHAGRLAVEKDVDTLVAAFRLAHDDLGRSASFCVAGDGPRAEAVRRVLPFATHLGFLDRARLADLYADADLFVFPSQTETCGLVALEAMASSVPVIAAAAGGTRENIRDRLTGRLVTAGDAHGFVGAIVELARDPAERSAMGQAARAFAVARDWSREIDGLEACYETIRCASRAAPAPIAWPASTSVT